MGRKGDGAAADAIVGQGEAVDCRAQAAGLDADRGGCDQRGCSRRRRYGAGGRFSLVQRGRWHARCRVQRAHWSLLELRGARGDRGAPGARRRCPRDRPGARPRTLDDLVRAATQRVHLGWRADVSGDGCAVARDRRAARPKQAKLASNERLHEYVQERLAGQIRRPDGTPVPGPDIPAWKGRRRTRRQDRRWHTRGVPGRSLTGCRSTSPTIPRCGSVTRPSTRRCSSRAVVRSSVS